MGLYYIITDELALRIHDLELSCLGTVWIGAVISSVSKATASVASYLMQLFLV